LAILIDEFQAIYPQVSKDEIEQKIKSIARREKRNGPVN
jgi:hypothetical protein